MDEQATTPEAATDTVAMNTVAMDPVATDAVAMDAVERATGAWPGRRLDSARVTYEAGRRVQAVALVMLRHQIVPTLGICRSCGRTPSVELPMFGPRCDVAVTQWRITWATLHRLLDGAPTTSDTAPSTAAGWAPVPPKRP